MYINAPQRFWFKSNFIRTSKYTKFDFLPKFILRSFHPRKKMANVYFLLIASMQCIPLITNTMGIPTVLLPLSFVIVVDGVFAALEDYARHLADDRANSSQTLVYDGVSGTFRPPAWHTVKVGDLVKVLNREVIPCDLVILAVKEKTPFAEGRAYVETKSLDGETNLKMRRALKCTMGLIKDEGDVGSFGAGEVEMEHPNKLIDSFKGAMELRPGAGGKEEREVISTTNILLRGCTLRNVDWTIGLTLNTGLDTKIMMSNTAAPVKSSSLELRINVQIKRIVLYLIAVCTLGAVGAFVWMVNNMDDANYLLWNKELILDTATNTYSTQRLSPNQGLKLQFFLSSIVQFFYYFLLMANFVPVSLYVSMSTVKYFQSHFIEADLQIYHHETDTPTRVRTMALNEELGQISHIFSDKTGTLTCNIMDFRKCSVNGVSYGKGITEIGRAAFTLANTAIPEEDLAGEELAREHAQMHKQPHVNWYDQSIRFDLVGAKGDDHAAKLGEFFTILALCHSVIPEHDEETKEIRLSASSPDDEALVCGAKFFGFEFCDRKNGTATLRLSTGEQRDYKILEMIEFNSTRKRMSVVVQIGDRTMLFCKGADNVMIPRLKKNQDKLVHTTSDHMTAFATEGLRTLMICSRPLGRDEFASWHTRFNEASTNLKEIEKRMNGEPNLIDDLAEELELGFDLVGASAIEDKLQEGVPECIADLGKAGIKIWVLTGDKVETAINIAVACRLLLPEEYMEQIVIGGDKYSKKSELVEKLTQCIRAYEEDVKKANDAGIPVDEAVKPRALVIDGPALLTAMEDDVQPHLLRLTQCCKAVVGCRVSPDQKRLMVQMVRDNIAGVKTLAIGDGANDVAMIQAAHVGIGISGQEGMQAVNASDYAIGQFKFLRRLLLLHGRWNYRRMSKLVCYVFYKNIIMSITQFWYAFQTGYSGEKFYFEGGIQLYNLLYTALPIMLLGVFDQDVSEGILLKFPQLYNTGIRDAFYNTKVFGSWILTGTIESFVISILPLFVLDKTSSFREEGHGVPSLWEYGATSFTLVVVVTNLKLLLNQYKFPGFAIASTIASIFLWYISAWGMTSFVSLDYNGYDCYYDLLLNPSYWLTVLLVVVIVLARDFFYKGYQRAFRPQLHHVLQEIDKFGLSYKDLVIPPPRRPRRT